MIIKISKEKLTIYAIYMLIIISAIGHVLKNSIISLMATIAIVLISAFTKKELLLIIIYICLPFFNILNTKFNTISYFYLILIIFAIKYFCDKDKKYKPKIKVFILLCLMLIFVLNISVIDKCLTWYMLLMTLVITYKENMLKENILRIINYYTISTILASAYAYCLLQVNLYPFVNSYVWNSGKKYTRFGGLIGDSNIYSQNILLIIAFNLILIERHKASNYRYILIAILVVFTLLTYSKMNIMMMAIIIFVYTIYKLVKYINKKNAIKTLMILFATIIGIVSLLVYIQKNTGSNLISSYIKRFSSKDLLTGRMSVYKHFIDLWKENPTFILWGIGFEKYTMPYSITAGVNIMYSHNIYIETISLFGGIFTTAIIVFILYELVIFCKKKGNIIVILPIGILFITGVILHGHLEFSYYYNLIIIIQLFRNEIDLKC